MKRLALFCLLLALTAPAYALRCGTRVVDEGDRDFSVRERCGEPFYVDQFTSIRVQGADSLRETQVEDVYDVWYYNFGPRKLMVRLLFLNGHLQQEETLGYGVTTLGDSCNLDSLSTGTSAGEIIARCGQPAARRNQRRAEVNRDSRGNERYTPIRVEEWTYDFGDSRLLRVLTLQNGRLQRVDAEGRD
ncbi:MAG: DUF2845 domain-containing protein [Rhodanobacteraceae bacterium]|nr:DUF2845 domain-containing protein [Rhodanobacteraceae bacterium]